MQQLPANVETVCGEGNWMTVCCIEECCSASRSNVYRSLTAATSQITTAKFKVTVIGQRNYCRSLISMALVYFPHFPVSIFSLFVSSAGHFIRFFLFLYSIFEN
jgi:hypothetical protein